MSATDTLQAWKRGLDEAPVLKLLTVVILAFLACMIIQILYYPPRKNQSNARRIMTHLGVGFGLVGLVWMIGPLFLI